MPTILIIDDEKNIRASLARSLRLEGYAALEANDGAQGLERLKNDEIDLVILDLQMPVLDGLGFLEKMAATGRRVPTLVLTAHGSIEKAVRAVRLGAFDFIEKPPGVERILLAVANALRLERLEEENRRLAEESGLGGRMLGSSPPMRRLAETISRVAPTDAGVLLAGE
ncbi:MAG TPA: response regulator, partial [Candidatus Polarisedimenticolia bacterium]